MHGNLPWGLVLSVLACHSHLDTQQAWAYICSVNDRPSEQMVQVLYIWDMLLSSVDNSPCASIRVYVICWCIEQCQEYGIWFYLSHWWDFLTDIGTFNEVEILELDQKQMACFAVWVPTFFAGVHKNGRKYQIQKTMANPNVKEGATVSSWVKIWKTLMLARSSNDSLLWEYHTCTV